MSRLRTGEVPWHLLLLALVLTGVGLLFVHSTANTSEQFSRLDEKQLLFVAASLLLFAGTLALPIQWLRELAAPAYLVCLLLLIGLFWFGVRLNGAVRWYHILGFGLQPSEFTKLALILLLAQYLRFRSRAGWVESLAVPVVLAAIPAFLVMRQPDLGSSMVFFPVMLAMSYAAGASGRQIGGLTAGAAALGVLAWPHLHDYQRLRVLMWWRQDHLTAAELAGPGYQMHQSLIAVGSAGWTGFGYQQGPQNRLDFLPFRSVDYIFAVVVEEIGILGAAAVLLGFLLLVLGHYLLALRIRERFSRLVVVGVGTWLGTQAFIHASVCTSLLPATGLPMPFFSAGGSALLTAFLALGLVCNVAARQEPVLAPDGFE